MQQQGKIFKGNTERPVRHSQSTRPADLITKVRASGKQQQAKTAVQATGHAEEAPAEDLKTAHLRRVRAISLPESFYNTPELKAIAHAAKAKASHPDGALGVCLSLISAALHPSVCIHRGPGLNFYSGIVAPPGGGKDRAIDAATALLPAKNLGDDSPVEWDLGTGEGLLDAYLEGAPSGDEDGKEAAEQAHERVHLVEAEAQNLFTMMDRSGATLPSVLLKMWGGKRIGTGNAKAGGRVRQLEDDAYRFAMSLGFQPEKISDLLKRKGVGFPHRFVLFNSIPETRRGSGGDVKPLTERLQWVAGLRSTEIPLPREIQEELDELSEQQLYATTNPDMDSVDSHLYVLLAKTTVLICLLHGRVVPTMSDFRMAQAIADNSSTVREYAHTVAAREAEEAAYESGKTYAVIDQVRQDAREGRLGDSTLMSKAMTRIINKVEKAGLCTEREAKRAVDSRTMNRLRAAGFADSAEDVLAEAVRMGVVLRDETGVKLAPR